jgi:uncharacterized protein (TIGR02246 family)
MNRLSTFAFALIVPMAGCFAQTRADTVGDETLIRAIPQKISSGWSRGDGSAVAAVYADAGTLVAGDGTVTRGRAQIASYHDRLFATSLKDTHLTIEIKEVRFLGPDIAVMRTEGGILWPGQSVLAPGNRGIQSFVAVRSDGTWRLQLFQNTRVLADR